MWFRVNLDGIDFHFRICGYKKSTDNWEEEWSKVDLTLQSKEWLNYRIENSELLIMCEIEELIEKMDLLLLDNINEVIYVNCIEPDLTFEFQPKMTFENNPQYIYIKKGYGIVDINMKMIISFWDGELTDNKMVLFFDRENLDKFLCYLKLIAKRLPIHNDKIQELIKEGVIYG